MRRLWQRIRHAVIGGLTIRFCSQCGHTKSAHDQPSHPRYRTWCQGIGCVCRVFKHD